MQSIAYEMEDESEEARQERISQQIQIFGEGLLRLAEEQVRLKQEIEKRWIDDLRHYNGKYDRDTESKLNDSEHKGSTVFVNLTRARTNHAEAKLSDLILPTDDKNWGIRPTPVPELDKLSKSTESIQLQDGTTAVREDGQPYTYADLAKIDMEEAKEKSDAMEREIDDQLVESGYNPVCRDVIHHACVLGTGIIKGPMVTQRDRKSWQNLDGVGFQLTIQRQHKPMVSSVDPWNFFPDMSATCFEDCEFIFERHLLTKKKVRDLLKRPGFMKNQVRDLLREEARKTVSNISYLNEIREINGISNIRNDNRYEVWEYHGPVKSDDLLACGCDIDADDPLEEREGVVWFSGGRVLKVALNHMDDNSLPYSVFCWEKDETNVFGFGVPYRMRASQKVMNGSWRMLLDNAGLSTGPQIIINRKIVQPANNVWELTPRKLWYLTDQKARVQDAFATFEINSHQQELAAIFEMAHTLSEEETSLPQLTNQIATENQPAAMKTLGGTALWMGTQNIMMRRAVKNWDDDVTIPFIGRMYDWNMQFNEKEEIKGDFDVDARGSSVLLVKEMQVRNMVDFVQIAMTIPGGQQRIEAKAGNILDILGKSMQIPSGEMVSTDDEMAQVEQTPQVDPEAQKLEIQLQIAQMGLQEKQIDMESAIQAKMIDREIELTKLAVQERREIQNIQKEYNLEEYRVDWDRQKFYEEINLKQQEKLTANYGLE